MDLRRGEMKYHRDHISNRKAKQFITEVSQAFQDAGLRDPIWTSHYGWENPDSMNLSVSYLIDDIKELLVEVKEYRALKAALKPIIKG